jgi:hypothetical protein
LERIIRARGALVLVITLVVFSPIVIGRATALFWGLAMSVSEKVAPSSSVSSSSDLDPLLKDLTEKKLSFRRNVVSWAAELKDVRNKLASQEQLFVTESQTRKVSLSYVIGTFRVACGVSADQGKILTGCRDKGKEHGRGSKQAAEMLTGEG